MSVEITTEQYDAVTAVLELDSHLWGDIGKSLSCTEAEVIVDLLLAFDAVTPEVAAEIIAAHAEGDDEGDSHWQGACLHGHNDGGPCPTCDVCDRSQCSTEDMEWNGETGNHVACEVAP